MRGAGSALLTSHGLYERRALRARTLGCACRAVERYVLSNSRASAVLERIRSAGGPHQHPFRPLGWPHLSPPHCGPGCAGRLSTRRATDHLADVLPDRSQPAWTLLVTAGVICPWHPNGHALSWADPGTPCCAVSAPTPPLSAPHSGTSLCRPEAALQRAWQSARLQLPRDCLARGWRAATTILEPGALNRPVSPGGLPTGMPPA